MASFDQLQCSLALSDSALAHDQNALAEYIDQHAVDGDHRSKLDIQPADDFSHENGSRFVYRKGRYLITIAQLQNFRSRNHLRGENDTWDLAAYKLFKRADALALFKMLQIRELYITDDLSYQPLVSGCGDPFPPPFWSFQFLSFSCPPTSFDVFLNPSLL